MVAGLNLTEANLAAFCGVRYTYRIDRDKHDSFIVTIGQEGVPVAKARNAVLSNGIMQACYMVFQAVLLSETRTDVRGELSPFIGHVRGNS